ncbi:MAG: hypothetical protein MJ239_07485 [Bacilli bacterium]|nr:hypothetical protein [Bacilli bacterium]
MLKLDKAIILGNKAPDKEVNIALDKGVTLLSYNQKYLYEFLKLDNQALQSGSFYLDDVAVVPLEDKKNSVFMLTINSKEIVLSACYLLNNKQESKGIIAALKDKERKERIKEIESHFSVLSSINDKEAKINSIFQTIENTKASYVLINWNNETNKASRSLISEIMDKYSINTPIIALEASNKQKNPVLGFVDKVKAAGTNKKSSPSPKKNPSRPSSPKKKTKKSEWTDITVD